MGTLFEFLGLLFGLRSKCWLGVRVAVGAATWFGSNHISERRAFTATAARLNAALPASLPGWSAPEIERSRRALVQASTMRFQFEENAGFEPTEARATLLAFIEKVDFAKIAAAVDVRR